MTSLGSYCPVVLFFHSPNLINKIKWVYEKIKLSEQLKPFELVDSVTMHYKNSQKPAIEISKIEKRIGQ